MPALSLVAALSLAAIAAPAAAAPTRPPVAKAVQAKPGGTSPAANASRAGLDDAAVQEMLKNSASVYDVLVGYMHLHRGNPANAYAYMLDAATRMQDERLYLLATEIALHARSFQATQKALEKWQEALPQDTKAREYYLKLLVASGQLAQSGQPLREIVALADGDYKQLLIHDIPTLYEPAKKPQQALAVAQPVLESALQQPDTAFVAANALARMQLAAGQVSKAADTLEVGFRATPPKTKLGELPNHELPGLIAMDLMQSTQGKEQASVARADALVQKSLRQQKPSPQFLMAYARTLIANKNYDKALQYLDQFLKQDPSDTMALALKGGVLLETKQYKPAEAALEDYVRKRNASEPAALTPPPATEGSKAMPAASLQMLELLRQAETDAQVHIMLAKLADLRNDPQAAAQWINRMPPSTRRQAMMQRIEWLLQQDKHDQALQVLALMPTPTSKQERTTLALVTAHIHDKQQNRARAVAVLDDALRLDKDNTELLYSRSITLDQLGRHAEAEDDLRRVIKLKPDSAAAYNALGYSLADRNVRLTEARELIAKALTMDPENNAIQDSMGWVEFRLGNLTQAAKWLQMSYENEPQAEIAAHYGEVLWMQGQQAKARQIWQEGLELDAKDSVLLETMRRLDSGAATPVAPVTPVKPVQP